LTVRARRAEIIALVERQGSVRVGELSTQYGVTPVTVHRDLEALSREGLVERIRGGARAIRRPDVIRTDWSQRLEDFVESKVMIAARARDMIEDGSTVFLDASTTAFALLREIERRPPRSLTVVTNSPAIAYTVHCDPVHVVTLPGDLDQSVRAIKGAWAVEFMQGLSFSAAFVSAVGLTVDKGLVSTRRELADIGQAAFRRAAVRIGLLSFAKFDRPALTTIAGPDDVDIVITDDMADETTLDRFRAVGYTFEVVGEPAPEG
jgi:DeoR family fructose operon transcriptional repressor